jgi:uncharacterized membrane protein
MAERKQSLFIVAYKGRDTADEVWDTVHGLQKDKKIKVKTAMVVHRKDNGKLKLVQKGHIGSWGGGALGGGIALLLAGIGSGVGLIGALIGALLGGIGRGDRNEVKDFLDDKLGADDSALALLVKDADWQAVQDATAGYGGEELSVELTDQAAMQIAALGSDEEVAAAVAQEVEVEQETEE